MAPAAKRTTKTKEKANKQRRAPGRSLQARETQLTNLALDLAEEQLKAGTATSQVITHFLRIATVREEIERLKLENENKLLEAKTESIAATARIEEMYKKALEAMSEYHGNFSPESDDGHD